jgi:hypothetical protein
MPRMVFRLLAMLALLLVPLVSGAQEIAGPDVEINDGHIVVSTSLNLSEKQLEDISKGISKEMDIYVDLFRVWKSWPDEFVLGTKFTRTITCNPVKKEFVATSLAGNILREKRFSDCDSLLKWALTVEDHKLTNVAQLEPARYFVKVTAESRLRKLPPVVGYLFFFVKSKDFKIHKNSEFFEVSDAHKEGTR